MHEMFGLILNEFTKPQRINNSTKSLQRFQIAFDKSIGSMIHMKSFLI